MHLKHLREKRIHDLRAPRSRAREQVEANKNIVLSLAPSGQSAA
ncbi:hypothetical protein [Nocardiopsis metallicus]|uniref:Uncharacterized protein n=1 Tax=Nocardiopsis metallicus TaxID=179819 RepID=A0A840WEG4_9ACTN|nr:hypothetical protein [Nocardiopsis metallicus]MBB5491401.1 hypothetical protein [Nocardiopsis metallicus]